MFSFELIFFLESFEWFIRMFFWAESFIFHSFDRKFRKIIHFSFIRSKISENHSFFIHSIENFGKSFIFHSFGLKFVMCPSLVLGIHSCSPRCPKPVCKTLFSPSRHPRTLQWRFSGAYSKFRSQRPKCISALFCACGSAAVIRNILWHALFSWLWPLPVALALCFAVVGRAEVISSSCFLVFVIQRVCFCPSSRLWLPKDSQIMSFQLVWALGGSSLPLAEPLP